MKAVSRDLVLAKQTSPLHSVDFGLLSDASFLPLDGI